MTSMQSLYKSCTLCPRQCRARRLDSETGFCRMSSEPLLGRASLHMWEEPCISGTCGSGTVFFAGCSLGCVYCQNRSMIPDSLIPGGGTDLPHCIPASSEELSSLYLRLRDAGAHNINLVTAAHFLPHVIESLQLARQSGLSIPVVYNTSGYERAESLALLEGLTDIYLTDFRYMHPDTASLYSHAPDYPAFARSPSGKKACCKRAFWSASCCFPAMSGKQRRPSPICTPLTEMRSSSAYSASTPLSRFRQRILCLGERSPGGNTRSWSITRCPSA